MWNFDKYETRRQQFRRTLLPSTTILESLHGNFFSMSGTMEKSQANFFLPPALIFPSRTPINIPMKLNTHSGVQFSSTGPFKLLLNGVKSKFYTYFMLYLFWRWTKNLKKN
jgi:hypothetical protein